MKVRTLIAIAILVLPGIAFSQTNFLNQNYIEVHGKATVKVIPDQIYLRIQISEKQKFRADMEAKERNMLKSLKDIGIPEEDLVVKDLASNFKSSLLSDDNIVISKVFVLLVHDAKTANQVISSMQKLQISNIKIDRLDHSKMADFKKDATIKAMTAAKAKAEALAISVGQSIGRALHIEEIQVMPMEAANVYDRYAYKGEAATSPDWFITDLDFDEVKIDYTVLARFELK